VYLWYDEGIMLAFQRDCKGREEQEIWETDVNGETYTRELEITNASLGWLDFCRGSLAFCRGSQTQH
jgi:hypothetical protein